MGRRCLRRVQDCEKPTCFFILFWNPAQRRRPVFFILFWNPDGFRNFACIFCRRPLHCSPGKILGGIFRVFTVKIQEIGARSAPKFFLGVFHSKKRKFCAQSALFFKNRFLFFGDFLKNHSFALKIVNSHCRIRIILRFRILITRFYGRI